MNTPQTIYNFLRKLESLLKQNLNTRGFFVKAFELESTNTFEINYLRLKLVQNVYDLAEFIQNEHSELEIDHTWVDEIINILTFPLDEDHKKFLSNLMPLYPHAKNFIGSQIVAWDAFHGKIKPLSPEIINNLKNQTEELLTQFLSLKELNNEVKSFVVKNLRKTTEILDHYQIFGNESIVNLLEESIGRTFTNKNYQDFMRSEKSESWRKYLTDLSVIVATSDSVLSISTTLKNLLP
jgi:hypothetical protein